MKETEIKARLAAIEAVANDPEQAHELEDALYDDFIESVRRQVPSFSRRAKLVQSSVLIEFPRWRA